MNRKGSEPKDRQIPASETGVAHFLSAARYSAGGLRRLWLEAAARQEIAAAAVSLALLASLGATAIQLCVCTALVALLLAIEAINTAIEVLTDHISPGWSLAAKHAKDLGSLAVALALAANAAGFGAVLISLLA
jgi:diacylglycerol kinase (ATP)